MAALIFRIYKNELDENRLDYIRKRYSTHIIDTPEVLEVVGEKEDVLKLYENYLLSESKFKAAYPDYMTRAERAEYTREKCESIKAYFRDTLYDIIANGELNAEYAMLRDLYLEHLQ